MDTYTTPMKSASDPYTTARLMIRSMSYSRYFVIATPRAAAKSQSATITGRPSHGVSMNVINPEVATITGITATIHFT